MKTITRISLIVLLTLLTAGCGTDFLITTRIFTDGTCERIMQATLDSANISNEIFHIEIDSTWERDTSYRRTQENFLGETNEIVLAVITVKKQYSSVAEMHEEFNRKDALAVRPSLSMFFNKTFKWFRTEYKYKEIYAQQFPFKTYPLSDYLSPIETKVAIMDDELADSVYFAGMDSLEVASQMKMLESRTEDFLADNIFIEFFQDLKLLAEQSNHIFFKNYSLEAHNKELLEILRPCFIIETNCTDTSAALLLQRLDSNYNTDAFVSLITGNDTTFRDFDRKYQHDFLEPIMDTYNHETILPGKIIETNADSMSASQIYWEFEMIEFAFTDYVMEASSVKTNYWAFAISSIIFLLGLLFTLKSVRRNR